MRLRHFGLSALILIAMTAMASAQSDWPNKPVRIVIPFAAGGSTDVSGRLIAQRLSEAFGQQFIIENRVGAGGTLGTDSVAKSPPDGYTLMMGTTTTHGAAKSVYKNLPYDPAKDFVPISYYLDVQAFIVVHPSVPANDLAGFIAYLKANPKKINYGSAGVGASQHMFAALFEARAGVEMQHIPYRGGGPAMVGLLGNDVQAVFAPLSEAGGALAGNQVKPIAVLGKKRHADFPNVVAMAEVLPNYELPNWNGLFAPAGTSPDIVRRIAAEVTKAVKDEAMRKKLVELGFEPVGGPPEQLAAAVKRALEIYPEVVQISGVTVQ
jgi:tripartite-type tricarboxylate transporter receptor subunit TctC